MRMIRAALYAALVAVLPCSGLPSANLAGQSVPGAGARAAPQPAPLRVFAATAVTTVLTALGPDCQRAAGRPLAITYGTSVAIRQAVEAGDALDLVILASDPMDALEKERKLEPGSRLNFARSAVAVGVFPGAPIDVKTPDGMKQALLAARAIAVVSNGAAIPVVLKMAGQLGVANQVKAKMVMAANSADAAALVTSGRADLVFNLMSELLPLNIPIAGPIPAQFDRYITYAAASPANSANARSAAALIHFLASPDVAPTLLDRGLEPAGAAK